MGSSILVKEAKAKKLKPKKDFLQQKRREKNQWICAQLSEIENYNEQNEFLLCF